MTVEQAFAQTVALAIKTATGPLLERIAGLEASLAILQLKEGPIGPIGPIGPVGPQGEKGDKGDQGEIGPTMVGLNGKDGKDAPAPDLDLIAQKAATLIPVPKDGRDAAPVNLELVAQKAAALIPAPKDGRDAAPIDIDMLAHKAAALIQVPRDGRDAPPVDLDLLAQKAAALIPTPRDGRDGLDGKDGAPGINGKDAVVPDIETIAQKAAALIPAPKDGRDGRDGKDADPVDLNALAMKAAVFVQSSSLRPELEEFIRDSIAEIPKPLNGKDGAPGVNGKDATEPDVDLIARKAAELITPPKDGRDGIGVAGALLSKDGELVLTLSDGRVSSLGVVVGQKGEPGTNGRDGAPGIDGKDGAPGLNGKDGTDGLGFDDVDLAFDESKGWMLRLVNGERILERQIPVPFDAGVWQAGKLYPKAAGVTVKGAWFIAREATRTRPDDGSPESSRAWRLAVKGGRDGKNGKDGRDAE